MWPDKAMVIPANGDPCTIVIPAEAGIQWGGGAGSKAFCATAYPNTVPRVTQASPFEGMTEIGCSPSVLI